MSDCLTASGSSLDRAELHLPQLCLHLRLHSQMALFRSFAGTVGLSHLDAEVLARDNGGG